MKQTRKPKNPAGKLVPKMNGEWDKKEWTQLIIFPPVLHSWNRVFWIGILVEEVESLEAFNFSAANARLGKQGIISEWTNQFKVFPRLWANFDCVFLP